MRVVAFEVAWVCGGAGGWEDGGLAKSFAAYDKVADDCCAGAWDEDCACATAAAAEVVEDVLEV